MTRRTRAAFAAFSLALTASASASASPELRVDGRRFVDAAGRTVILRGVNVAGDSKVPPFTAASDPAIFDPLPGWGMNAVRLLFTWEAYEPKQGEYDQAYLDYYAKAAEEAWKRGLYVIADFHQDAFSRWSNRGCGEGFPQWALPPDVTPLTPDNGPECADWGQTAAADVDMAKAWTAFYADTHGVRTRYLAMLKSVATRLEKIPGVIGYDLINEPWGDEPTELAPFQTDGAAAVREASPSAIVFVSPVALTSAGLDTYLPKPTFDDAVYSPHFYLGSVLLNRTWAGDKPTDVFHQMEAKAAAWGVPLLLGEFGAPAQTVRGLDYVDMLYDQLDAILASGTQWVYSPHWTDEKKDGWNTEDLSIVDGTGALRDNFRPRPAAQKIAGTPTRMKVTHTKVASENAFELEWDHDPSAGDTELFVPVEGFFGGASPSIEATSADCAIAGTKVKCSSSAAGAKKVVIRVAKAPADGATSGGSSEGSSGCAASKAGSGSAASGLVLALFALACRSRSRARVARR